MISLIHKKKSENTGEKTNRYALIATEEILFWGGLCTLAFGTGWIALTGGAALCASVVLAVFMFVYS